jgi:hypothetical protein
MRRFTWLPVCGTRAQPRARGPCGGGERTPGFARDRGPRHSLGSSAGSVTCAPRPARIGRTRPMQLAATRETARAEGVGSRLSLCRADSVHGRLRPAGASHLLRLTGQHPDRPTTAARKPYRRSSPARPNVLPNDGSATLRSPSHGRVPKTTVGSAHLVRLPPCDPSARRGSWSTLRMLSWCSQSRRRG